MLDAPSLATALRALLQAGRFREAVQAFAESDEADRTSADALWLVATAHGKMGEFPQARVYALEALAGFTRRLDDDGAMKAENLLGAEAFERGDLDEAARRFAAARRLAQRLDDTIMLARTANNLASVRYLRGEAHEARPLYREALLAYQRLGDRRGMAETYHNLGIVARDEHRDTEAVRASEEAVRHARQAREAQLLSLALCGRAESALRLGDVALADDTLARAETLAREVGHEIGVAEVDRVRAMRWWEVGVPARALEAAERARAEAVRLGSALLQGESAALAAAALKALGRTADAAVRRAEAEACFTALGATLHLRRL